MMNLNLALLSSLIVLVLLSNDEVSCEQKKCSTDKEMLDKINALVDDFEKFLLGVETDGDLSGGGGGSAPPGNPPPPPGCPPPPPPPPGCPPPPPPSGDDKNKEGGGDKKDQPPNDADAKPHVLELLR